MNHREELRRLCRPEASDGPFVRELKAVLAPAELVAEVFYLPTGEQKAAVERLDVGFLHAILHALDGIEDDDTVRPSLILEEMRDLVKANGDPAVFSLDGISAGELRAKTRDALAALAHGDGPEGDT